MTIYIKKRSQLTEDELRKFDVVMNKVTEQGFPCVFAQKVGKNNSAFNLFISNDDFDFYINGLIEYTNFVKNTPSRDRILTPLIVFIEDKKSQSLEEQHINAWKYIQCLIDNNPTPNPYNYYDVNNPNWCLIFNDVELFTNISTSKHNVLRSRNLGYDITIIVNPREIFDEIAPYNKPKGIKIRNIIRNRVTEFNQCPVSKELGFFGHSDNLEWKQYQLYEKGGLNNDRCPLHFPSDFKWK